MNAPVDVLAGELRVTNTEYSPGITTTIAEAAASLPVGTYWLVSDEARAAVAELVAADREYEAARKDWDRATASHPGDISEMSWQRIAGRFEAAVMRRAAALAKFGEA